MSRDWLRRYPLLALLSDRVLDALLAAGQEMTFGTGETIFQEGTPGVWAYLVLEGRVRILRLIQNREKTLGLTETGDLFGEYALLPPHRNTATCRAASATRLLQVPLLPLTRYFRGNPAIYPHLKSWLRLHALLGYLRGRAFLGFMSMESMWKLLELLGHETFAAGETIQASGLGDDRWYCIESGQVQITSDGQAGSRLLGAGDFFGEHALLAPHGLGTAVAQGEVRCGYLTREQFAPRPRLADDMSHQSTALSRNSLGPRVWIGQQELSDCGLASLAMILRSRGNRIELAELRKHASPSEQGLSLRELTQLATSLGLPAQAARVDGHRLAEVSLPVVAHLEEGHYVVVYEQGSSGVVLADPATGLVTLSQAEFLRRYSGHLVLFAS